MQSRRASLIEAAANVAAGLVLALLMQLVLFSVMGIAATLGQNLVITAAFSVLSIVRSYSLRRLFDAAGRSQPPGPASRRRTS